MMLKLYENNSLMVGFGRFHNKSFVRLVTINGENSYEEISNFFSTLENFANTNSKSIKRK